MTVRCPEAWPADRLGSSRLRGWSRARSSRRPLEGLRRSREPRARERRRRRRVAPSSGESRLPWG
eukprot:2737039-Alexandrium_andersonii.AAC.1